MRIAAFILLVFITAMAIMPCADTFDDANPLQESYTHFEDQSHDHSENEEDGCTPFCICQCCGTSITIPSFDTTEEMKQSVLASSIFHYSSMYSLDYSKGVWHPPTLS